MPTRPSQASLSISLASGRTAPGHRLPLAALTGLLLIGGCATRHGDDFHPRYSPDGRLIAFYTYVEGVPRIMVMNADGSARRPVTAEPGRWDIEPRWLPDGTGLAFGSGADMRSLRPHRIGLDGADYGELYPGAGTEAIVNDWLPDGRLIVTTRQGTRRIGLVNPDGTWNADLVAADDPDLPPGSAQVAPDGARIAFVMGKSGEGDIWLLDLADRSRTRLTTTGRNASPAWSPDGTRIAFVAVADSARTLRVMDADGGNARSLTPDAGAVFWPDWAPAGDRIVFSAKFDEPTVSTWSVAPDGSDLRRIGR